MRAHKSPNPSLISATCVFVLEAQPGTPANQEIMTGPLRFIFGAERRKQHLTCGLEVGGGGGEMASEPTCQRSQTTPWQRLCRDEWQLVCQPPDKERGDSAAAGLTQQTPGADPSASVAFFFFSFFQGSCWHSHFDAPAKDSMAYLQTEQQCSIPENDICTGRSICFSHVHISCCHSMCVWITSLQLSS